ncbi:hypothetical protein PIB30_060470 [Stylosanthes scabra]|uniref:Uncharacterized protein n=1 Tax=Stylosanthes scabra TaxID=79078 RepID=A0ABU6RLF7_9FABA|nr:hypothetical protein [Stylosanthes scabra]
MRLSRGSGSSTLVPGSNTVLFQRQKVLAATRSIGGPIAIDGSQKPVLRNICSCLLKPSRIIAAASLLHTTPRRVAVPFTTKFSSPLLRPSVCSWPLLASAPRHSLHIQLRRIHSPAMANLSY